MSERQWDDAGSVLRIQEQELDMSYLRRFAAQMGVADLLDRALDQSR